MLRSADFLTVSSEHRLIVTEAKFSSKLYSPPAINCKTAIDQLKVSMEQLVKKGVAKDVELVQLAIPKGAPLGVGAEAGRTIYYTIKNGYLLENGKRIPLSGKSGFFVTVLEL